MMGSSSSSGLGIGGDSTHEFSSHRTNGAMDSRMLLFTVVIMRRASLMGGCTPSSGVLR